MSTNTTFSKVIWPGLPSGGRLLLAVSAASIGTAAYMLAPSLSWRESIPAITMLVGVGLYLGGRLAVQVNTRVMRHIYRMAASVDDESYQQRMQARSHRHPLRIVVYRWSVIAVAGSYLLVTFVTGPLVVAAVFAVGIGALAGLEPGGLIWVLFYPGVFGLSGLIVFTSSMLGFHAWGIRLLRSLDEHREHTGDPSTNGHGAAMQFESEISQLIPPNLIHA